MGVVKKKREERRPGPRSLECTIPFSEATQLDEMETSGARRDTASIAPWRILSLVLRRFSPAWKYNRANIIPPAWRDGGMPENKFALQKESDFDKRYCDRFINCARTNGMVLPLARIIKFNQPQ